MRFMSLGKFDTYVPGTGEQNQLPSPRHHHRPNPLRGVRAVGSANAVLRNLALPAGCATGGARVKQTGMDNRLRLRATVMDCRSRDQGGCGEPDDESPRWVVIGSLLFARGTTESNSVVCCHLGAASRASRGTAVIACECAASDNARDVNRLVRETVPTTACVLARQHLSRVRGAATLNAIPGGAAVACLGAEVPQPRSYGRRRNEHRATQVIGRRHRARQLQRVALLSGLGAG